MNNRAQILSCAAKLQVAVEELWSSVFMKPNTNADTWYNHFRIEYERVKVDHMAINDNGVIPYAQRLVIFSTMLTSSIGLIVDWPTNRVNHDLVETVLDLCEDLQGVLPS
jgi:hypothetical protein